MHQTNYKSIYHLRHALPFVRGYHDAQEMGKRDSRFTDNPEYNKGYFTGECESK